MNTVMMSFNTTVRQMTKMSQQKKDCYSLLPVYHKQTPKTVQQGKFSCLDNKYRNIHCGKGKAEYSSTNTCCKSNQPLFS